MGAVPVSLSLNSLNNNDVTVSVLVSLSCPGALEKREHVIVSIKSPGMDKWSVVLGPFEILQTSL